MPPVRADQRDVRICAHRGASDSHPENTLAAFARAVELGCEMIEFDLRVSADSEVVVMHDSRVDRTTNGTGQVADLTLRQIRRLDAGSSHSAQFAGEQIPTLAEVLRAVPPTTELNIHVADGPRFQVAIAAVDRAVREQDRLESAFIAGSDEVVSAAAGLCPDVRRCLLDFRPDHESLVERAVDLGCWAIQPESRYTRRAVVERAHAVGMRVHPYKADDDAEFQRLAGHGVDGVLTDYPARLLKLRGSNHEPA